MSKLFAWTALLLLTTAKLVGACVDNPPVISINLDYIWVPPGAFIQWRVGWECRQWVLEFSEDFQATWTVVLNDDGSAERFRACDSTGTNNCFWWQYDTNVTFALRYYRLHWIEGTALEFETVEVPRLTGQRQYREIVRRRRS